VEPFVVGHGAGHVVVVLTPVRVGVAGNLGVRATRDNDGGVGLVAGAGARVVDENITRTDVGRRSLAETAGAGPAVLVGKAVTKVLGTNLLLAARIATARTTLVQMAVATSNKALGNKVGTVTTMALVVAVLTAVVGPRSAGLVTTAALVVGTVPPGLGICNSLVAVVSSSSTSCKGKKSNNSLHVDKIKKSKEKY